MLSMFLVRRCQTDAGGEMQLRDSQYRRGEPYQRIVELNEAWVACTPYVF